MTSSWEEAIIKKTAANRWRDSYHYESFVQHPGWGFTRLYKQQQQSTSHGH